MCEGDSDAAGAPLMTDLKDHLSAARGPANLLAGRFSKHPERYFEIFRVLRKYELHHIVAELGMSHHHAEDVDQLAPANGHDQGMQLASTRGETDHGTQLASARREDDHGTQLASALEELGPCFIKLGQLLSTRPDLLPPDYIHALARLQDTIQPVPAARILQI